MRVSQATSCPARLRNRWSTSWCDDIVTSYRLADLDRAAVLEMRAVARVLDRLVVAAGLDHVVAAQHFLRLAVRPVGDADLSVLAPHHLPGSSVSLSLARHDPGLAQLLAPGDVLLDDLLHLVRADVGERRRVVVQQQHVFRHGSPLVTVDQLVLRRYFETRVNVSTLGHRLLAVLKELPRCREVIRIVDAVERAAHVAGVFARHVRAAQELELNLAARRVEAIGPSVGWFLAMQ